MILVIEKVRQTKHVHRVRVISWLSVYLCRHRGFYDIVNVLCRNIAARKEDRLMPQRHRPRLKRILIRCDGCGSTALKLYPSRESVRQKLSPYKFCSSTCQREHWEARRKAEWSASSYPCAQCGATITPQQASGRPRTYCTDACKQAAARERLRRQPAGAVMAARQRFDEAWRRAVTAAEEWEELNAHGWPVWEAYRKAGPASQYDNASDEQKVAAMEPIRDAIAGIGGPHYGDEPNRYHSARGDWVAWWKWWLASHQRCRSAYEHRLEVARAATEELRKRERVAARRAETARLRRAME